MRGGGMICRHLGDGDQRLPRPTSREAKACHHRRVVSDVNDRAGGRTTRPDQPALVEVMEPANLRGGVHTPERGRGYRSGSGRDVVKRLLGPHGVVVGDVAARELPRIGLAENYDVVQSLAALRTGARVL